MARVLSRAGEDISNFRLYEDDDETLYSSYAARMVGSVRMESRDLGLVKNLLSAKQQAEISDEELLMGNVDQYFRSLSRKVLNVLPGLLNL